MSEVKTASIEQLCSSFFKSEFGLTTRYGKITLLPADTLDVCEGFTVEDETTFIFCESHDFIPIKEVHLVIE